MMGLDLPSGGHLTHGYYTAKKKISASSIYFETLPYKVHSQTGLIDFDELRKQAHVFRPAMLICGASAYPRVVEWEKFRKIADEVGALLMADMAHISGLVATGLHPAPFEYCDVVTTTAGWPSQSSDRSLGNTTLGGQHARVQGIFSASDQQRTSIGHCVDVERVQIGH